jgi:hypothetical protein
MVIAMQGLAGLAATRGPRFAAGPQRLPGATGIKIA